VLRSLSRVGIPLGPFSLLTGKGRKTGKSYTFPVTPIARESKRWLISPYGEVSWVQNARGYCPSRWWIIWTSLPIA
jgi:hypothetical protein